MEFAKCNCESRSNISCYKSVDKEKQIQKDEEHKMKMLKVNGRDVRRCWKGGRRLRGRGRREMRERINTLKKTRKNKNNGKWLTGVVFCEQKLMLTEQICF